MRELVPGRLSAYNPGVGKDLFCIESVFRLNDEQFPDEVLCALRNVVPVRRGEFVLALLDHVKKLLIIILEEGREAA
jgi:hypothetical protein